MEHSVYSMSNRAVFLLTLLTYPFSSALGMGSRYLQSPGVLEQFQSFVSEGSSSTPLVQGTEVQLVKVTSDATSDIVDFKAVVDDKNNLVVMRYSTNNDTPTDVPMDQLAKGFVIMVKQGFNVATLKSEHLNAIEGGQIQLIYLSHALWKSYDTYTMDLVRAGDRWSLHTTSDQGGQEFTTMFLQKRTMLGQVVGIEKVIVK